MHGKAKEQAEIDGEKEIVETSTVQAIGKNEYGNLVQSELQEKLDSNTVNSKTEVIDNGDTLVVKFIESNRYYEVDSDGNVSLPITITEDENAGDLTKGGTCDGTENNPFKISCIEDLVVFSQNVNAGNNYSEQYIELTKTLDFNSIFSYSDCMTIKYGDLNTDGVVEDIKTELTKTDEGCIGFTPIGNKNKSFSGNFCGNGYQIANIYENVTTNAGLFGYIKATISDLTISGKIKSNATAAGICAHAETGTITNCRNYAIVEGNYNTGGIIGYGYDIIITNCVNFGDITNFNNGTDHYCGGIAGCAISATIINCSNERNTKISGGSCVGGIVGKQMNAAGYIKIFNSYNLGKVIGDNAAGGIIGYIYSTGFLKNVYSTGEVTGTYVGGLVGSALYNNTSNEFVNCYYQNSSTVTKAAGKNVSITSAIGVSKMTEEIISVFNEYIDSYEEEFNVCKWKCWKIKENEFPTLTT